MAVATQHCAAERGEATPAIPPVAADVLAGQRAVQKSLDDVAGLKRDADDIQDRLDLLQAERNDINKQTEAAARSGDIIAVLKVFEDSQWPLAKQLVYVPPGPDRDHPRHGLRACSGRCSSPSSSSSIPTIATNSPAPNPISAGSCSAA